jgi:hypothetical protein
MSVARRLRKSERVCDALILIGPVASGALLLATAGYFVWCAKSGLAVLDFALVAYVVPPLSTIATFVLFRRALARRPGGDWRLRLALLAALGLTLWCSWTWFGGPMHDIALAFGSHGRFGCETLNEDGSPVYFIRDGTMPWLLFGPPLLGVIGHGLIQRRRGLDYGVSA